jgi:O-antigen ligase
MATTASPSAATAGLDADLLTHPWRWARERLQAADEVTVIALWVVLLFGLPERMVLPALGAAGAPSAMVGIGLLLWWIASRIVPSLMTIGRVQPMRQALVVLLILTMFLYVVAVLRGLPPVQQRASDRYVIQLLGLAGVTLVMADGIRTRDRLDAAMRYLTVGGAALALMGLVQQFTGFMWSTFVRVPGLSLNGELFLGVQRGTQDRISATANHPIGYATGLALMLPLAVHLALTATKGPERQWRTIVAIVIAGALPLALSRSAVIALTIGMIALFTSWDWRRRVNALGVFVGALVVYQVALPGRLSALVNLFRNADQDNSVTARTRDYETVFSYIADHRWFGMGPGVFIPTEFIQLDNQALKSFLEGGLVGALAITLVYVTSIRLTRAVRRLSTDPETRQLARCLSGIVVAAAAVLFTFDSFSYGFYMGVVFFVFGAAGALWRLVITEATWPDSPS